MITRKKVKFTQKNLDRLVKLKQASAQLNKIAYTTSKSSIEDLSVNLKKLSEASYAYRNATVENAVDTEVFEKDSKEGEWRTVGEHRDL